ncbi:glycoside hydrolase family 2 TIM barrel-domain containing protein [Endomicrobium proavitum]|uniref:Glycoside hydrolase family 2 catalytic domain-containing protein n=1 Tax=Endomicrobium proavitum TaxID=1408281 RepID=A0A0G3WI83_9BACT|nr:glycoside hydrolase family 2 TIM barrel-domain containing protein [Endomicrobium proavitum]AKL98003.1 conserved exported protein of unknown function [Endomicrobium proavitum]
MNTLKTILTLMLTVGFSFTAWAKLSDRQELTDALLSASEFNRTMTYEEPKPFKIYDAGNEEWIDYSKYGVMEATGTAYYSYVITNSTALAAASGEGIYPNQQSVLNSPDYKKYVKKLNGDKFKFIYSDDYQANFYKWATVDENPGLKLYYAAFALEKAGNYKHAVKAYYACMVLFPKAVGWTQMQTPWYIAPVCVAKIKYLTKTYPEIGVRLVGEDITIQNVFDNDYKNDVFIINPGKLVKATKKDFEKKYIDLAKVGVKNITGAGRVKLIQYKNNHFKLTVNGEPFTIKAVSYSPSKVGLSPDFGTLDNLKDWTLDDYDKNGRIDGPFDAWVDANRNDKKDRDEYRVGDFALMKAMGVNTLRVYHHKGVNKKLLREGYNNYGFMSLVGNLIGMYGVDSGAYWYDGTDYADNTQIENMLDSVRDMVNEFKDEPYVLAWVLGNENNYGSVGVEGESLGSANKTQQQPEAYYKFVNEAAKLIKKLDPKKRPVVLCNGDTYMLDYAAKYAPEIDVYGANAYRGDYGFGAIWRDVQREFGGKPVLITEYGCPAYAKGWSAARIEKAQAAYHKGNWGDIEDNLGGISGGIGNALGGVIFEWVDEWWKAGYKYDAGIHDTDSQWAGPFLDGSAYEEWFGITSQGSGGRSPFERQLRKAYFMYMNVWNEVKN